MYRAVRQIRPATRDEVVAVLGRARDTVRGPSRWTLPLIDLADRQFGAWQLVMLQGREAAEVVLPPHAGEPCHGDTLALIGSEGATVASAAQTLDGLAARYRRLNRSCWQRIEHAGCEPFSPLILTTEPLDHPDYRSLGVGGSLFHLDGLHRLLGWQRAGRLTEVSIEAWVAGRAHHFWRDEELSVRPERSERSDSDARVS
jgi:GNAT superfamily N-acetyltransferase